MDKKRRGPIGLFFAAISSLRLTVTLLAMGIFLVFAGTLAQVEQGVWHAVHGYFRTTIAWINIGIFDIVLPFQLPDVRIPFPGGFLLGGTLLLNLLTAHAVRYKVKARGGRLALGLLLLAFGVSLTTWIVVSYNRQPFVGQGMDPYWRVARQLAEGAAAGGALLLGCLLLFRKKAGVVLLHAGVALLMINEVVVAASHEEGQMTIREGASLNYVVDTRKAELAVIDPSDPDVDKVVVVPASRLRPGSRISHPEIPFDIQVVSFLENSTLYEAGHDANPANRGMGLHWRARKRAVVSGVAANQAVDMPSAYLRLVDRTTRQPLGTWLTSTQLEDLPAQSVETVGRKREITLRFKRTYKPYRVHLVDFRFDRYPGTNRPKNYSSDVLLVDEGKGVRREVRIWMNNPLRYRGDTLYQASFAPDERGTVLQIVRNPNWMIPYVSCMIVAIGMLAQFGMGLLGFLRRRTER